MSLDDAVFGLPLWLWAAAGVVFLGGTIWWARFTHPGFRRFTDRVYELFLMSLIVATIVACLYVAVQWLIAEAAPRMPSFP